MRYLVAFVVLLSGTVNAAPCLDYRELSIRGTLTSETFPGPPNYENVASGDRSETYYFVAMADPACVVKGASSLEPAADSVQRIQLIFEWQTAQASYDRLKPLLGKTVECRGVLLGRLTGHHHSEVMLTNARCHAT